MENKDNLIDRYLFQVGRDLPANKNKRADIQAELRSLISDELENRYPGQEHTPDQVAEVLQEFGPPEKVAASYFPEGQYLIGPRLYPLFRMTLGIVITIVVIVQLVLFGVSIVFQPDALADLNPLSSLFSGVITAFGIIVLIYWVMQRYEVQPEREEKSWDPYEMPAMPTDEPVSRVEQVVGIAFSLLFIGVLALMPQWLAALLGPQTSLALNPLFYQFIPYIIGLVLLGILLDVLLLWRGRWETWTRVFKIVNNLLGLALVLIMLTVHNDWLAVREISGIFMVPNIPESGELTQATAQALAVQGTRLALMVAAIVMVVDTVVQLVRLVRAYFNRARTQRLGMQIPSRQG